MDGSTMTSCVEPLGSFTCGKMSGCASIPRASPKTGIVVKRVIPFFLTDACVSCVSRAFHPLLALSAERVSQGAIFCAAKGGTLSGRKSARIVEHFVRCRFSDLDVP
jgi:hypothetical protein